jgi:magnesium-transporting ATPase (P-type)/membrane-associated phospholipid phosphatase
MGHNRTGSAEPRPDFHGFTRPPVDADAPTTTEENNTSSSPIGLGPDEVLKRVRAHQTNEVAERTSRTIAEIVRANVLTRFNALLGTLLVVMLVVGSVRDALFGGVLVANALIGIIQELRAKRVLDRLSVLSAPTARVIRSARVAEIPIGAIVLDDVVEVGPGDQIVADGVVLISEGLEVDESLITGEATPISKPREAPLLSGSFVTAGHGFYRAAAVGAGTYAHRIGAEARRYKPAHSEIQAGINQILRLVTWALVPLGPLLVASQLDAQGALSKALQSTVAGLVPMVPEGLVLLTSLALATAVTRLGRRSVLLQDLPAVEVLARVDVVCLDKTGTITEAELSIDDVEAMDGHPGSEEALGALASIDPRPNASLRAIAAGFRAPRDWRSLSVVPFSSGRRWSGASFEGHGTWILGAPEVLLSEHAAVPEVLGRVAGHAAAGRRVLVLAHTAEPLACGDLPSGLRPAALVTLAERVRPDAGETLRFLREQNIALKVISGDHPRTVAAVAGRAGLPDTELPVDARDLPQDQASRAALIEAGTVFGRASPQDKVSIIDALRDRGRIVAMIGDGVNDVLALKAADIGIAMGSGSAVTRGAAQLVLLDGRFSSLPSVLGEGRRIIANVERLAALFVTKTIYALLLVVIVGIADLVFPFLPRHLTLVGSLTIGIPAFFLSLAPNAARAQPGFVTRVLRFAFPAGILAFAAALAAYLVAGGFLGATLEQARTAATLALFLASLWVLAILSRPVTLLRGALIALMAAAFATVQIVPPLRAFFAFEPLPLAMLLTSVAIAGAAGLGLEGAARLRGARAAADRLGQPLFALFDPRRGEARSLAVMGFLTATGLLVFFAVLEDVVTGDPLVRADAALFHFLQSLRGVPLDRIMVAITELGDGRVTAAVAVAALYWFVARRLWRTALYWIAAVAGASLFIFALNLILHLARPTDIGAGWDVFAFPAGHAAINAAFYGFLAVISAREARPSRRPWIIAGTALFVSAIAFSRLYLGAHWLSDAVAGLSFSVAWVALLGIAYLRHEPPAVGVRGLLTLVGLTVFAVGGLHIARDHAADMARYAVRVERRTITLSDWWRGGWAQLPARRLDLAGMFKEPLTVQWAGDLNGLKTRLLSRGWHSPVPWSRRSGFAWLTPHANLRDLPVTPRLQDGHRAGLALVHEGDGPTRRLVLRLWRSDVDVRDGRGIVRPLWVGTVVEERMERVAGMMTFTPAEREFNAPRDTVAAVLDLSRRVRRSDDETVLTGWDGRVLLAYDSRLVLLHSSPAATKAQHADRASDTASPGSRSTGSRSRPHSESTLIWRK